jgi:hypothetical protein
MQEGQKGGERIPVRWTLPSLFAVVIGPPVTQRAALDAGAGLGAAASVGRRASVVVAPDGATDGGVVGRRPGLSKSSTE